MNHGNAYCTPRQPGPLASVQIHHQSVPYGPHLIPNQTLRCARCGVIFHPAVLPDDRALLLASCCPRCDGALLPENGRAATRTDAVQTTT